jgi:inorganic pyrophosphatase
MGDFQRLPVRDKNGNVHVVVEAPRGSAAKLEFDPDLQAFTLSKSLILGLSYPYDWVSGARRSSSKRCRATTGPI